MENPALTTMVLVCYHLRAATMLTIFHFIRLMAKDLAAIGEECGVDFKRLNKVCFHLISGENWGIFLSPTSFGSVPNCVGPKDAFHGSRVVESFRKKSESI